MRRYLYFVTFVAALGGLMFGFETAVINGTIFYVAKYFNLTAGMKGFVVSTALIGCVIGVILIGKPADKYGRRYMLRIMAFLFFMSMIGTGLATQLWVFISARFIGGLAIGGSSVIVPMYISEVAPPDIRGRLVATNQFSVVLGILVAFFSNYIINIFGEGNWRMMFLAGTIPSGVLFILLFFIVRSPRWLIKVGKIKEAHSAIKRLDRGANIEEMIDSIKGSLNEELIGHNISLFRKPYLRIVLIGMGIGMFNQLAGINIINYYSTDIFRTAGFSGASAMYQSVLIGATNLFFTVVGMALIDRVGRKFLLYIGAIGMPITLGMFSWAYITGHTSGYLLLVYLLCYIACFAVSQGTVICVMLSEIFPTQVRARGVAMGYFSHWFFNIFNALLFPVAAAAFGVGYVFLFFFACTLLSIFFYKYAIIETKGKTLEEIERMVLVNRNKI
jgi:sugar porter (SP) family MFS transporter